MDEIQQLYQELILDHGKSPRNFGQIENASHFAHGNNPLCGDKLKLYLQIDGDIIKNIKFDGSGCAISMASSSLMSEFLIGKNISEAEKIFKNFHDLITSDEDIILDAEKLGKLTALSGVKQFPMRVKCATLAWHTLDAALHNQEQNVTTETI